MDMLRSLVNCYFIIIIIIIIIKSLWNSPVTDSALPRQQWSLLNRFCTRQGHWGACKKKWKLSDSDQCSCSETQTMSHIVESCPQTRLQGGCLNYTPQMMMPLPGWPVMAPNAYNNNNSEIQPQSNECASNGCRKVYVVFNQYVENMLHRPASLSRINNSKFLTWQNIRC